MSLTQFMPSSEIKIFKQMDRKLQQMVCALAILHKNDNFLLQIDYDNSNPLMKIQTNEFIEILKKEASLSDIPKIFSIQETTKVQSQEKGNQPD